jgi:glycosyltransferase involved in cell wall biosynthesis
VPAVSVILPTRNRAHRLRGALTSVLEQTYTDFELIVVDDASDDETPQVIEAFQDLRIRYLRLHRRVGAAAARDAGVRLGSGHYLAFQDSDDVWLPTYLATQLAQLDSAGPEVGVSYTRFRRRRQGRTTVYPDPETIRQDDILTTLLRQNVVTTQAALVRRDCFEEVGGFDPSFSCLIDWDLWLRLAQDYHFRGIAEPLVDVHYTPGSISADRVALAHALLQILGKHADIFADRADLRARHLYSAGHLLFAHGHAEGLRYLRQAVHLAPETPRYRLALGLALAGPRVYARVARLREALKPTWY